MCTAILFAGCGGGDSNNATTSEKFIHIATGNVAGTYYPIGGGLSEILNQKIEKMHAGVQATSGSVSNIQLLKDGTVELAIIQNDIAYYAVKGEEMFKDQNKYQFENLRALSALYPEICQIMTLDSSGIKSVSELKGKKVAVGAEGSGAEANARQILEIYGLSYDDIDAQYLSFSAASKAIEAGTIDAAFLTAGCPTIAVQAVAAQKKIRILPLDDEHIKALTEKYPFYTETIIPKNTYTDFDEDVKTVSVMALLVCNENVSDDLGYQITKTIFENLDTLKTSHPAISQLEKSKATEGMTIDLNKGADKFFKEK